MVALNKLQKAPPYPAAQALTQLGANLRTARVRRKMTIADVADRIGTGPRAVMDAEKGKPSTGIIVYTSLLWLYDLLQPFEDLADPLQDKEGLTLQSATERTRVRKSGSLDNDF